MEAKKASRGKRGLRQPADTPTREKIENCKYTKYDEKVDGFMITIAHVLVGGATAVAVATLTPNPVIILAAAVATHFVLDAIPHLDVPPNAPRDANDKLLWTPAIWTQVFLDVTIAGVLTLGYWATRFQFPHVTPFVIGAFGGFLPDLIDNVPWWNDFFHRLPGFKQVARFHNALHDNWEKRFPMQRYAMLGVVTQVVAIVLAVGALKK